MNETTTNQTLEFEGQFDTFPRLGTAVACACTGIMLLMSNEGYLYLMPWVLAVIFFMGAAFFLFSEHTYLDFTDRQIVTVKRYCGFEISKRSRPLTDFSNIVVRGRTHIPAASDSSLWMEALCYG